MKITTSKLRTNLYKSTFDIDWNGLENEDIRKGYAILFLKNWLKLAYIEGATVNIIVEGDTVKFDSNYPDSTLFSLAVESTNKFIKSIMSEPNLGDFLNKCKVQNHPEFSL